MVIRKIFISLLLISSYMYSAASLINLFPQAAQAVKIYCIKNAKENPQKLLGVGVGSAVAYSLTDSNAGLIRSTRNVIIGGFLGGFATHKYQSLSNQIADIKKIVEATHRDVNLCRKEVKDGFATTHTSIATLKTSTEKGFQATQKIISENTSSINNLNNSINRMEKALDGINKLGDYLLLMTKAPFSWFKK